jgi:DNA-binding response OmpR family regulator
MTQLLLVEDDQNLGASIVEGLSTSGMGVTWAHDIGAARRLSASTSFDLALLDILLPDGSGLEFGKELKSSSSTPVIFLSAVNTAEHRLAGYEIGGEDFIPKPFFLKELLLLIERALSRRAVSPKTVSSGSGDITLHLDSYTVRLPDGSMRFPQTRDFKLLALLVEESPKVVSREVIVERLWSTSKLQSFRPIDNGILRLRQLLGPQLAERIRTVRSVGYQWLAGDVVCDDAA